MKLTAELPDAFFKEEERSILISEDRKRLWAVQLDLLMAFDRVCRENGIKYMLDAGTLLGAARHGGFIPWDDDVDVVMIREEYEKLNAIASKCFREPYFWQTFLTDPDHGRGFARLRNSSTTYILNCERMGERPAYAHNQGVFIDVFIGDSVPDTDVERAEFMDEMAAIQLRTWQLRMQKANSWSMKMLFQPWILHRKLKHVFYYHVLHVDIVSKMRRELDQMAQKYNGRGCKFVSRLTFTANRNNRLSACVPRYVFEDLTTMDFEGHPFSVTRHWDEYLTIMYGNWHKHVIAHDPSGGAFIDLDNSYTKYVKAYRGGK